jgi:hypothetical protein
MSSKQKLYMGAGVSLMALLALLGFGGEAKADDTVPEPKPKDDDDPQDVLDEIYSDSPVPGKLYLIKQGDNLSNISIRAMQAAIPGGLDQKLIPRYQKCVSASAWNRELYGLGGDFTEGFPKWTSPDNISIRSAFFPDHDNAISAILNKQMPDRGNFIRSGNGYSGGAGSSYGLLWLPPVNKETLAEHQEPQCALQKWPDGTSAMEPPAVLFKLFGGA